MAIVLSPQFWMRRPTQDSLVFLSGSKATQMRGRWLEQHGSDVFHHLRHRLELGPLVDREPEFGRLVVELLDRGVLVPSSEGIPGPAQPAGHALQHVRHRKLCDPTIGIVRRLESISPEWSEFGLFQLRAQGFTNLAFAPYRFTAVGKGTSAEEAIDRVFGEAIERYSAGAYSVGEIVNAEMNDLGASAIDPRSIAEVTSESPSGSNGPYRTFSAREPHNWVRAVNPMTGESRFVLAQFVYVPFSPPCDESLVWPTNSSALQRVLISTAHWRAAFLNLSSAMLSCAPGMDDSRVETSAFQPLIDARMT